MFSIIPKFFFKLCCRVKSIQMHRVNHLHHQHPGCKIIEYSDIPIHSALRNTSTSCTVPRFWHTTFSEESSQVTVSVSIFLNFWTHRHTDTEMDTELDKKYTPFIFEKFPFFVFEKFTLSVFEKSTLLVFVFLVNFCSTQLV